MFEHSPWLCVVTLRNLRFHEKKAPKTFYTMLGKNEWYVPIGSGYILYHDFWSYNLQYFISEKSTYDIYVRLTWIQYMVVEWVTVIYLSKKHALIVVWWYTKFLFPRRQVYKEYHILTTNNVVDEKWASKNCFFVLTI